MSKFAIGDVIQIYRSAGIPLKAKKGVRAGTIATVINEPVAPHNIANGYDMVVRTIDGRVGAIHSAQWRLLPAPDEEVEAEEDCCLAENGLEKDRG